MELVPEGVFVVVAAVTSPIMTAERLALIVVVVAELLVICVMDAVFNPARHAMRWVRLFTITR